MAKTGHRSSGHQAGIGDVLKKTTHSGVLKKTTPSGKKFSTRRTPPAGLRHSRSEVPAAADNCLGQDSGKTWRTQWRTEHPKNWRNKSQVMLMNASSYRMKMSMICPLNTTMTKRMKIMTLTIIFLWTRKLARRRHPKRSITPRGASHLQILNSRRPRPV